MNGGSWGGGCCWSRFNRKTVGDLVAYAGSPMGSYAEEQILSAYRVVPVPSSIDPIAAVSVMLMGLAAHYLIHRSFQGSLDCLKLRGHLVLFGQSSGAPDPVPISALAVKPLFLTRPTLMHYTVTRDELMEAAGELFENIGIGVLKVCVDHKYPLSQAAEAHTALEIRQTTGSVVLITASSARCVPILSMMSF